MSLTANYNKYCVTFDTNTFNVDVCVLTDLQEMDSVKVLFKGEQLDCLIFQEHVYNTKCVIHELDCNGESILDYDDLINYLDYKNNSFSVKTEYIGVYAIVEFVPGYCHEISAMLESTKAGNFIFKFKESTGKFMIVNLESSYRRVDLYKPYGESIDAFLNSCCVESIPCLKGMELLLDKLNTYDDMCVINFFRKPSITNVMKTKFFG